MSKDNVVVSEALYRILRPLVRILIRHGVVFDAFVDILRRVYVEVAENDFTVGKRKQSTSRIAVLTGLSRKEVAKVRKLPAMDGTDLDVQHNRAARVISGWLRDREFFDTKGDPDDLPFEGERSFSTLVKRHGGDVPPRAVADELLRVGAMEYSVHGDLRLTARGYVPGDGDLEKLNILGTDVSDLIATIDHNLTEPQDALRFQRKVAYNSVNADDAEEFRRHAAGLSQHLLEQLNQWLAQRAANRKTRGRRVRLGLGIFQFQSPEPPDRSEDQS